MLLYLSIISVCYLLLSLGISLGSGVAFWIVLLWTGLAIVLVVAVDGLTAGIVRLLPPPKETHFFEVSGKEKQRYEKWHIRTWKDKIPEIGHFTGFRKNRLADPKSAEYIKRFLMESRYGEVGHLLSCPTGALIFLFALMPVFPAFWWQSCLGVFVVNFLLNLPPVFVLRYNYYKLTILYRKMSRKNPS